MISELVVRIKPPWNWRLGEAVDSTDAPSPLDLPTGGRIYPMDSTDAIWDSGDATRGYPVDFTDETNSLKLITFE